MGDSIIEMIQEEVKLAKKETKKKFKSLEKKIGKLKRKVDEGYNELLERITRARENGSTPSVQQINMTLLFKNNISPTILTGDEIKGVGNTYIELNLVDCSTGKVVETGPESSANVEIVLLQGVFGAPESSRNWTITDEDFNENIFRDAHGKKKTDFLKGNVNIKLQNGVAVLSNIRLRNGASESKPPVFALGARAVKRFNGVNIRQAKTNSFTVEIYRKKYFKKSQLPSLSDEVYRLSNIRKGGVVCRRLKENGINNVEDFLIQLMIDRNRLESIMKISGKKFAETADHALRCQQTGQKMFCYRDSEKKTGVVFDVVGTILGLYHENQYYTPDDDSLSEDLKVVAQGLFKSALENWKDVASVNDDILQCFASNNNTTEMMYSPLRSADSPAAVVIEPFSVDDVEMDYNLPSLQQNHPTGSHFYPETMLQDSDKFIAMKKRWKKVRCVFKWLCLRKNC